MGGRRMRGQKNEAKHQTSTMNKQSEKLSKSLSIWKLGFDFIIYFGLCLQCIHMCGVRVMSLCDKFNSTFFDVVCYPM